MGKDAPYGRESMTYRQHSQMQKDLYAYDRYSYSRSMQEEREFVPGHGETKGQVERDNEIIRGINQAAGYAAAQDTMVDRIREFTKESVERSSWLTKNKVPKKAKLDAKMDKAEAAFGIYGMSKSQRTKRGKKFNEKAKLQSLMISEVKASTWMREDALYGLMEDIRNGQQDKEASRIFAERTADQAEDLAPMMKDLATWYRGEMAFRADRKEEYTQEELARYASRMDTMQMLVRPERREEAYRTIIKDFEDLDISMFDYKNDQEFVTGNGRYSFARRHTALRGFSRMEEIIERSGIYEDSPKQKKKLIAKAKTIKEILEDYDRRALFLQSPYYTLLAGKDVDSFSDEEIRSRIVKTEDPYVRTYLEKMLENRRNFGFAKGRKAKEVMEENLNPEKREKKLEEKKKERDKEQRKVRKKELEEQGRRRQTLLDAAEKYVEPKQFDTGNVEYLKKTAPGFYGLDRYDEVQDVLGKRIIELHTDANRLNQKYRRYEDLKFVWKDAAPELYQTLVLQQQRLSSIDFTVQGLKEVKASIRNNGGLKIDGRTFSSEAEVDALISELTESAEYHQLLSAYLQNLTDMEFALDQLNKGQQQE